MEHGEVASLECIVQRDERITQQQHDLIRIGHHHLRLQWLKPMPESDSVPATGQRARACHRATEFDGVTIEWWIPQCGPDVFQPFVECPQR